MVEPTRAHRRHLVLHWKRLETFGRLTASGIHNRDRIILTEFRCRPHQGAVAVEQHRVRIVPEAPLRERWRLFARLPLPALFEWYATGAEAHDALCHELSQLILHQVPLLVGARAIHIDKMGRITASLE